MICDILLSARSIHRKGEVGLQFFRNVRLEYQGDIGVSRANVMAEFEYGLERVIIVVFANNKEVAWRRWPFEGQKVVIVRF